MSPPTEHEKRFVAFLETLAEDERRGRAALAALRRGLGKAPGEVADPARYVVPWLPADAPPWQEEPYYLVATLFAWHQGSWRARSGERQATNLGASLARLAAETESGSIEQRFVALLNCHRDDLADHLRRVVGLLKAREEIPVDWAQLLHDVPRWDWESRSVQRDWARAFWGADRGGERHEGGAATASGDDTDEATGAAIEA